MKGPKKTLPKVFGQLRAKCFQHTAGREGSSAGWNFGGLWWWSILESRGWTESCHGSIQVVVADFCLFLCNSSFLFDMLRICDVFLNLCPSSAWAVSDARTFRRGHSDHYQDGFRCRSGTCMVWHPWPFIHASHLCCDSNAGRKRLWTFWRSGDPGAKFHPTLSLKHVEHLVFSPFLNFLNLQYSISPHAILGFLVFDTLFPAACRSITLTCFTINFRKLPTSRWIKVVWTVVECISSDFVEINANQ